MFFALNTFLWSPRFEARHLPLLEHVKTLGADTIELQRSGFEDDFPVDAIRRELERLGLGCTLSTSPPRPELCLLHEDADARRAALGYLREAVAVARDLGAGLVVGPLYAPPWWFSGARSTPDQQRWAVEGLQALGPDLQAAGVHAALEPMNRFETFFLNTAAQSVALCEAVNHARVGMMLDTAHMAVEEKDPCAAVRAAGPWLKHLHLPETDRGAPGTGRLIDWPGLFAALAEIGYVGGCAIESFPYGDPEVALRTRSWRDLAPSTDDLARDGLAFLKRTWRASLTSADPAPGGDGVS